MSELNGTHSDLYTFEVPLPQGYTVQTALMTTQSKHAPCEVEFIPSGEEGPSMIRVRKRRNMSDLLNLGSGDGDPSNDDDGFFYQLVPFDISGNED